MAQSPREGYESLAGFPWMPRMIDKARLDAQGEIEPFDLEYPCPRDQMLLRQLGIDGKTFQDIVMTQQTDDAIVAELSRRGIPVQA